IDEGKRLLIDELTYLGVENFEFSQLVDRAGFESADELFYSIAIGETEAINIVEEALDLANLEGAGLQLNLGMEEEAGEESWIVGQGDLHSEIAECCQPVPGDPVVGVINDKEVVFVHREDCLQALKADV
ncbi:MAG: hypothetical protein VW831_16445, partial [Gammaproteobacteria bacterium]